MAAITEADVAHIARLAELDLDEQETQELMGELGKILDYVGELSELDTTDVPPTAHLSATCAPTREDQVAVGLDHRTALAGAPRTSEGGFAVPGFVED